MTRKVTKVKQVLLLKQIPDCSVGLLRLVSHSLNGAINHGPLVHLSRPHSDCFEDCQLQLVTAQDPKKIDRLFNMGDHLYAPGLRTY